MVWNFGKKFWPQKILPPPRMLYIGKFMEKLIDIKAAPVKMLSR
jgi:hypothetical protein